MRIDTESHGKIFIMRLHHRPTTYAARDRERGEDKGKRRKNVRELERKHREY